MGLDYRVGDDFYKRIGTYSEAAYFDRFLALTGLAPLPIAEEMDITAEQSATLLVSWFPRVRKAVEAAKCEWAGEEPPEEYQPDESGSRRIPDQKYPLNVTVGERSGEISPGGFRAGCTPDEFLMVIKYIAETIGNALAESAKIGQPIVWS